MSSVNRYLNETPLTTTKNKLLDDYLYAEHLKGINPPKRKLKSGLLLPQKCHTVNRFILNDKCLQKQDDFSKKKQKKFRKLEKYRSTAKRPRYFISMPMDMSRSNSTDLLDCADDDQLHVENCEAFSAPPNFVVFGSCTPNQSQTFGSATQSQAFGFYKMQFDSAAGPCGAVPGFRFGAAQDSEKSSEIVILKMPTYQFNAMKIHEETETISSCSDDFNFPGGRYFTDVKGIKMQLLNVISMALMFSSNLKDEYDQYRMILQKLLEEVRLIDPEFILKLALYARQELQIRIVANFLLSYAAVYQNTRIFLEKYFDAAIVLPTDWIQVAEYFQVLSSGTQKQSFPAVLRRVMKKSFPKFDKYQLAKYNRDKTKKKHKKEEVSEDEENKEDEKSVIDDCDGNKKVAVVKKLTLKRLIRSLHIDSPSEHVMCLLGKKYPKSHEEFKACGLPGAWDPTKAGTRMKLPVPETWETQISASGNKPYVWESLIDNKKLPYMATLRNLKNLILSGISPGHHKKVINYLENKKSVINSRQLPMQFYEAFKVICNLEKMLEQKGILPSTILPPNAPAWKKGQIRKIQSRMENASASILHQYKSSISKALEISSLNNLHPIPGKTLIICEIGKEQLDGTKRKNYETCIMMGLMCLKACEDGMMNILSCLEEPDIISLTEDDVFLDILMKTCEKYEKLLTDMMNFHYEDANVNLSTLERVLDYYLKPHVVLSLKLDHIVLLQTSADFKAIMSSFLHKYRQIVNSDLLYTNVNFNLSNKSFTEKCITDKNVYLCGSSSSFIKFIAERSTGGQLACVENIDMKYDLPEISESKYIHNFTTHNNLLDSVSDKVAPMPLNFKLPKWHTVRIFISSTFKDMMSERDLLVRYVFPELRRRAASVFIRIVEIDLRWGITERDSSTKRAAELCLTEAQKADLFVGFIGERYGTIYNFEPPDSADLQWVEDCPTGLSITELEMHAAALRNPDSSQAKAFFYFRNNSFLSHVPKKWANSFTAEDLDSKRKVDTLKDKIRSNNLKVLDGYPCHWAGIYENKPVIAGLDILGKRVLEDLWTAVQEIHKTDPYSDSISEEEMYQQNLIESNNFYIGLKNLSVKSVIDKVKAEQGIFVICGDAGSGKTTFLINLLQYLKTDIVVKFFIGISPRSQDVSYILQYVCRSICHQLGVSLPLANLPIDIANQFPDLLLEAANLSGGREIILIIDGLDHLENDDQRLDWLPLFLPNRIKLICSTCESSQAFEVLLERRKHDNPISFEKLPLLLQSDREQFVRNYLSYYGKSVDESAFNNNMLLIATKRDSSNPYYLRIVCDFLRIYASYENLEGMLQKLPSCTILLFQEIIIQMENEFGSKLVQSVLSLLCITKEGLEDMDLHYVLSFIMQMNDLKILPSFEELKEKIALLEPENLLSQVKFCSLIHVISTFAYGPLRQKSLSLVGTEFESAVKKYYLNKNFVSYSKNMHCFLAGYYHNMCDENNEGKYRGQSGFSFRGLLYHMFNGCLYKELTIMLCNHKFIEAVFKTKAEDQLLEYYSSLIYDILPTNQILSREIDQFHLFSFYDFVSRNFHIFHQYPQLVMQQALNEPFDSAVNLKSEECSYYSLENLSRADIMDCRLATFSGFVKNITASAGEKVKPVVILGSDDGYLKVLDLSTRKVDRTIKGHVSTVTCICFVGKIRMCVSSADGTLSLWNSDDFSRIFVLKGHMHNVTSCCSDPSGSMLYSSGWDNTVRLWSARDGRSISVIEDFRCPVNCIDHHPVKQMIACGLWNGNIEIWDTISLQRKLVFSNFSGSVKSLAYTPDGVNIISSYIQSEISIWSSEEGLKISSLKGHILPVKALTYSFDDSIFISGSDDCTLKVWSTTHGAHFCTITDSKFCPVSLMEFMSDNFLAVAFQNSEIWVIDINSTDVISKITLVSDILSIFSKYSVLNLKKEISENNYCEKSLVFGTQAGKLMINDLLSRSISTVAEMNSKITAVIHSCEVIFCGTADGDIGIFSYQENNLSKIVYGAHKGFIGTFCLTIHSEQLFALSTANDNVLKLWSIQWDNFDLTLEQEFFNKHRDGITYSLFYSTSSDSPILSSLFTGSHDNNIISWNDDSVKIFHRLQSSIVNIACSGEYILGCGNDGSIVMWSQNGTVLSSIPGIEQSSATLSFYVAEDDTFKFRVFLAFVDQDGSIQINKPLQRTYSCSFDSHSKPITSCCTTENGEVVSCSLDGSVNLWKVPFDIPNRNLLHVSVVTGIILSSSYEFAVSSDAHGDLILWKIHLESSTSPLTYVGKKSYNGGFIRTLSWLKNNNFVCAVSQVIENNYKYFLNVISLECGPETSVFNLQVKKSYDFDSEVLCLDACDRTDVIVVGLKSGDIMCITPKAERIIRISDDWLLRVCLFTREKISDLICVSLINGSVKLYSVDSCLNDKYGLPEPFGEYISTDTSEGSKLTSSICCGEDKLVCCGDSEGFLRIYIKHSLKFNKKVHDESISGICIVGSYLFTSSLDKTVKGWNLKSFKQVCQFHSYTPISCLSSIQTDGTLSDSTSYILLIGTTSGNVHLLKFHCK